ncbi:homoserine kinase [Ekhidna sp.]|uniref:homoserine kinase n=1 Tax=Ekhidna sp. TaxID=2608089 RepID=UPI003298C6F5
MIKVFAPASVANIGCGYDTMGFAVTEIGEEIQVTKRPDDKLVINEIVGADLSYNPEQNVATIAIQSLLDALRTTQGFDISIHKFFKPGSGLGSSASSAAGAVFAVNELLNRPFKREELLQFALEGEAFASSSYHADNVAPSLLGGVQVIRSYNPLDVFRVEMKSKLEVLLIFPDVEVKTAESKKLLPTNISMQTARNQWGNVAGLIHAFHIGDNKLLRSSIMDLIAEPVRKSAIPKYEEVKRIVLQHGSVGFNISGSGPSMFALFDLDGDIEQSIDDISGLYQDCDFDCKIYRSKIDLVGCKVIS